MNRYVVFQDPSLDGANIDERLRDTNDRRWLAGPAQGLPSTEATTIATTATAAGQLGESADANARGRQLVAQGKSLEQEICTRRLG